MNSTAFPQSSSGPRHNSLSVSSPAHYYVQRMNAHLRLTLHFCQVPGCRKYAKMNSLCLKHHAVLRTLQSKIKLKATLEHHHLTGLANASSGAPDKTLNPPPRNSIHPVIIPEQQRSASMKHRRTPLTTVMTRDTTKKKNRKYYPCKVPDCHKHGRSGGLCVSHGGGRRCSVDGCSNASQRAGKCYKHGSKYPIVGKVGSGGGHAQSSSSSPPPGSHPESSTFGAWPVTTNYQNQNHHHHHHPIKHQPHFQQPTSVSPTSVTSPLIVAVGCARPCLDGRPHATNSSKYVSPTTSTLLEHQNYHNSRIHLHEGGQNLSRVSLPPLNLVNCSS